MNLSLITRLIVAVRAGLRIAKLVESRTTRDQWQGLAIVGTGLSIAVAIAVQQFPDSALADPTVAAGIVATILAVCGPVLSRIMAFTHTPDLILPDPARYLVKVKKLGAGYWENYDSTAMDAAIEGYAFGVARRPDGDGDVIDLRSGDTVDVMRLPKPGPAYTPPPNDPLA